MTGDPSTGAEGVSPSALIALEAGVGGLETSRDRREEDRNQNQRARKVWLH